MSKYEPPILVPLGEVTKGAGALCAPGTIATEHCAAGGTATIDPGYCEAGTNATPGYCHAGASAQTACTAGVTALTGACTEGTHPGA